MIKPEILTSEGIYFDFNQPEPSMVSIQDIAQGLSNTCRFAGQCRMFYSVAEHSIHVSYLVPREMALVGLLHDAAEAYVGDVTAPLKQLLTNYKAIEERAHDAIFEHFGLNPVMPPEIKKADLSMLAAEQAVLMPAHDDEWDLLVGIEPADREIRCLRPFEARYAFLDRFRELAYGSGN